MYSRGPGSQDRHWIEESGYLGQVIYPAQLKMKGFPGGLDLRGSEGEESNPHGKNEKNPGPGTRLP